MPQPSVSESSHHQFLSDHADEWLSLAIENILREYPHMPWILASGPESYRLHRETHPVFFGSFDWHSCVEMYWVAVRLMRLFPGLPHEQEARDTIGALLTLANVEVEAAFFRDPAHGSFERPYGWGWLLTLWHELSLWHDPDAALWHKNLSPLAETIMDRFDSWLPKMTYPQRIGMHANTAFGLTLAWKAVAAHRPALLDHFRERAITWFGNDTDYPARYEPSGADFLSPGLCEAVLMSRVLGDTEFRRWFGSLLPELVDVEAPVPFVPARVSDSSDGQIAHLHGLNLSRAWALLVLANRHGGGEALQDRLVIAADQHAAASIGEVQGSDYMVEHWLAAYALLLLTESHDSQA